ncbi:MAG TPA: SDR family NAD(P)-dependent oxidoreductase, partial [Methylomirabilota bacterium]|nr:SDR family NAD(P)-dependent oxidoreductase [Methylomirabilota bacterium]
MDLRDKTAVITGGASGIGRALTLRFAREGANVVVADVDAPGMEAVAAEARGFGVKAVAVATDVSQLAQVQALALRAFESFGAVHVLCNNAGVAAWGGLESASHRDWQWVLGVNLWGVIHGVRSFVPRMIAQGEPAHVVNTASLAGLSSNPFLGVYNVTKHAVVTLSETLAQELAIMGTPVRVSVLCPGFVQTQIADSQRNRPA